ncbi:hypothetical protein [Pelosinus fermentans]|uniref:Uncharacterized protein n=1 Tax=Pelosinus fermentans JBW45 TaxID=1192197 RepID=I9NQX7_9FIRM|nr:hypothetical protein [Pelosinus fermentans]AJQ28204.1 hypothetical protein JBW_02860 [Pelosinus fermentans JBW45]
MDEKTVIDGSYTRYRMPTEKGLAKDLENGDVEKEVSHKTSPKSTTESYVFEHNSVK